jgi:hypothetical protein
VLHSRSEDTFEGRVDLGQQAADAVGDPGSLPGEVVVEADQDFQLGESLVADIDPAKRVRQGAGRVSPGR